jgi:S1-C subfamily serine protease
MRRFYTFGPALVVLTVTAITLVAAPAAVKQIQLANLGATVTLAQNQLDRSDLLERLNDEVAAVGDSALPSTVHLRVRNRVEGGVDLANGSGWVLDHDGHIVTNAHVVAAAEGIRAEFYDGRVTRAQVVGLDARTDIAVLKVDPGPGLFPIRRATDEPLRSGERVYAFGSPFGISFSMTEGIVSGLGRSEGANALGLAGGYTNYIQTDAAINPGNSGGPLVNVNGRLVGMNTSIANAAPQNLGGQSIPGLTGQSAGIGFAVPLETIERVTDQIINYDFVLRGYLGVSFGVWGNPDPRRILEERGVIGNGALVGGVVDGQPAAKAGMRPGDVIVEIDGRPTPTVDVVRSIVSVQKPGDTITVTVVRQGEDEPLDIDVKLGAAADTRGGGIRYIENSENMTTEEIIEQMTGDG